MGLLATFGSLFGRVGGRKAVPAAARADGGGAVPFLDVYHRTRAPSPAELVRECLSTAFACATLNSDLVASTPLRLYLRRRRGQKKSWMSQRGDRTRPVGKRVRARLDKSPSTSRLVAGAEDVEEVTDHPLLDLLGRPNGTAVEDGVGFSLYDLVELTQRYLEIVGRCYWYVDRSGPAGTPAEVWVLAPQYVTEVKSQTALGGDATRLIDRYRFNGGGVPQEYSPEEVVPFRVPDMASPYVGGCSSPMRACFEQVSIFRQFAAQTNALLRNGGRPDAIWNPKGDSEGGGIGPAEAKRMRLAMRQAFAQAGRGGVMIAEVPGSLEQLTWPTSDLISPEQYLAIKTQIANCFGVPATKLDRNDGNRASAVTGDYAHAKDAGLPRCRRLESTLNAFVVPMYDPDGDRLFVAFDSPVPDDEQFELEQLKAGAAAGAVKRNEFREAIGLPAEPWGDQPLAPSNVVPVDEDGKPQPPASPFAGLFGNGNADGGGQPADPNAPPGDPAAAAAGEKVQWNGAQITAAKDIVIAVTAGQLPRDAGIALLVTLFALDEQAAERMMASAGKPDVPTTPNPVPVQEQANGDQNQLQPGKEPQGDAAGQEAGESGEPGDVPAGKGAGRDAAAKGARQAGGSNQDGVPGDVSVQPPVTAKLARPLPQGESLASILRVAFAGQLRDVLAGVETLALDDVRTKAEGDGDDEPQPRGPLPPARFPERLVPLTEWNEAMASAAQPVIEIVMRDQGERILTQLAAAPDAFSVVNRRIPEAARSLALRFAESTNATTGMELDAALAKLREEIEEGIVEGDARVEMRDRVRRVFDRATKERAETIARTEASRATHQAELIGAAESGVVTRKLWLASADACPVCEGIVAAHPGGVPLENLFADFGGDYGRIDGPPAHPNCQCSLTYEVSAAE